ncbi:SSI family serine proteinase inhibitor [Actinokineospora sp. NBRC 105648]|uniref:SSI family serine proteinase inhibitor n=1 Tax=Actinokineospora sp. NBRC 105648 TaxID=3032206 RepID=UPI0024A388D7|nr:SSI family serine proteinase inhibitor [Actinokineospora sp. NBRC 105648]GLZ36853.1 hypothetical protein Acsp05_04780 [Actinokineospora sp. NBRC 105648]
MSAKTLAVAGALAAATALLPAGTAAAQIAPVHAVLYLTVHTATGHRDATLECAPDLGSHPDPTGACARLSQVNGNFSALNVNPDAFCTLEYDPVVVTAHGRWGSRFVWYAKRFSNPCALRAQTGAVFAL